MEPDTSQWPTNYKHASVKFTDGSVLNGVINIGEFKRLSDKLKRKEENIVVLVGTQTEKSEIKTYIVNTEHVIWVETKD